MPKLAAREAKAVEKAQEVNGGFEPFPPGKYTAELSEVEVKTSSNDNPYWNCVFTDIEDMDGETMPGRQWLVLMLPQEPDKDLVEGSPEHKKALTAQRLSRGRIKSFFSAFGLTPDSDTDEAIGERLCLRIGVETIKQGAKKGERTNRVNATLPLSEAKGAKSASSGDDDDEF